MPKCIALIGRAGSGKSTIGKALAKRLGYLYISTGDIARTIPEAELLGGFLAPESAMRAAFARRIVEESARGYENFIVDGMPRMADQVKFLCNTFNDVLFTEIVVSKKAAVARLKARGRADDNDEAIEKRMGIFDQNIGPISSAIIDAGKGGAARAFLMYGNYDFVEIEDLLDLMATEITQEMEERKHG